MTSFHHQSEAQHPKSSAIHKHAGRISGLHRQVRAMSALPPITEVGRRIEFAFGCRFMSWFAFNSMSLRLGAPAAPHRVGEHRQN